MRWTACGPKVGTGRQGRERFSTFRSLGSITLLLSTFPLFRFLSFISTILLYSLPCLNFDTVKNRENRKNGQVDRKDVSWYYTTQFTTGGKIGEKLWILSSLSVGYEWRWRSSATSSQVGPSENEIPSFPSFFFFLFPLVSLSPSSPFWFKRVWLGWKRGDGEDSLHLAQGSGYIFHVDFFILSCHPVLL